MSDFFGKLIAKVSAQAGFPIMVYEYERKSMLRCTGSSAEAIPVPSILGKDIEREDLVFESKTVGGKSFIIYFLRCVFGGHKYVVVINDTPERIKLGRFFVALTDVLRDVNGNRDALSERIKILKDSLDEKIDARDKAVAQLNEYENRIAHAIKIRNEAIVRLKAQIEENTRLKSSSSTLSEAVKRLELSIREKESIIAELKKSFEAHKSSINVAGYEEKINQITKVRNEAIIRLKAQMAENAALKNEVSNVQESVHRLEMVVREKNERMAGMQKTIEKRAEASNSSAEYEEKISQITKVRNEAVMRLKGLIEDNKKLQLTIHDKEEDIEQLNKDIQEKNDIVRAKDTKIAKTRFYLEEMTELVKVVKKSRDKIMTLTDFITVPMYSVSSERTLVHANNALASYIKSPSVAKIVGKSCYKLVFGFEEPCPWCQLEKVQKTGLGTTIGVMIDNGGKRSNIELTIFPILDSTGTLIDCGEFLVDKTDTFELAQSLKKFKEQVMSFKRAKISGMNEIQDVKKAYDELSANYDLVVARNNKLSQALESLLVQDNSKDVINARTEIAEYKASINRANGILNNYKRNLEELQSRYSTLNKQAFTQIERLINVVKSKPNASIKEISDMLASIGINFEDANKMLGKSSGSQR